MVLFLMYVKLCKFSILCVATTVASFIVLSYKMPVGELLHWPIKENLAQPKELIKGMELISLHAVQPNIHS